MTDSTARRNPYIIGRSITERESFFGRESLFQFIEDNLRQNIQVILLHGQRRIGKSSVLQQIPGFVAPNQFAFIPFDLEYYNQQPLYIVLQALAKDIINCLDLDSNKIRLPSSIDLKTDPNIFHRQFLSQVYQALDGKKLVLLLDEFDALIDDYSTSSAIEHFFPYLSSIIYQQDKLFIILCVGRQSLDLPIFLSLFNKAPTQEIGLLDEVSAKRLITKPAEDILIYEKDAITEILKLSAGHPYFIQVICFNLFGEARNQNNWKVTLENVQKIVDKAIGNAEGGLVWFWDGLYTPEQVVFSAVAEAQEIANEQSEQKFPEDPFTILKNYGVIQTEALTEAAEQLAKKGFLDDTKRRVKVELVRRWLVKAHPLRREIMELEKLEAQKVNSIYQEATKLDQEGKKQDALAQYEKILEINPNYFSALVPLAEGYLEVEEFDKAVEFYDRAYKVNPIRNKQGFINALERYGDKLKTQRQFTKAKEQYNRILAIEPNKRLVEQKLREIDMEIGDFASQVSVNNSVQDYSHSHKSHRFLIGGIIAIAVGIVSFVGTSLSRLINPCLPWEGKIYGFICQAESSNTSRGEKSFFSYYNNPDRDKGIEAFKKQNYSQAAGFFNEVVTTDNLNKPEALIYYNNAKARQQGSPLTLAVVVPIQNKQQEDSALEMLRGVAQAQDQFNKNGGLNHRLLEIVIANDGNNPDQAKQVAQELVKDESILGVIGHYSSTTTKAALTEYKNANLPIISPVSTSSSLQAKVFFRTDPSDAVVGKRLAEYVRNELNVNKVAIFYNSDSSYSKSLKDAFTSNFKPQSNSIRSIDLSAQNLDIEKEVKSSVKQQIQTALLFPDWKYKYKTLEIAKANVKLPKQQRLRLLGGEILYSNDILQQGKSAVEGLIVSVPWFRDDQQSKGFADASRNTWRGDVSWLTATSFDATQAFLQALRLSPSLSRDNILQKLPDVKLDPNQTSGYPLQFQDGERRDSKPILVKVEGGKFRFPTVRGKSSSPPRRS